MNEIDEITQPSRSLERFQPIRRLPTPKRKKRHLGLWSLLAVLLIYFLAPLRTNILLLGTDDSPERGSVGRTDTIILTTILPTVPYVGLLSIPRDLWVNVPDVGEQRINTAYFFAEANHPGAGPEAAMQTIRGNFGVPVHYYAVIHMAGLVSAVDALGGVDIRLESAMGGYSPGTYHVNGEQALSFIRERSTSDDFSRMQRTQLLIVALGTKAVRPDHWKALPGFVAAGIRSIDTDIPLWQLPRLLFVLLRVPFSGVDSRTITREMVVPSQTAGGAQVLLPDWNAINPVLREMFGS